MMLKNIKINVKLLAGFGFILALLIIISVMAFVKMSSISTLIQKRDLYSAIVDSINSARNSRLKFLYTSDNQYKDMVNKSFTDMFSDAHKLQKNYTSSQDQDNIKQVIAVLNKYKATFTKYAAFVESKATMVKSMQESGAKVFQLGDKLGAPSVTINLLRMRFNAVKYITEGKHEYSVELEKYFNNAYKAAQAMDKSNPDVEQIITYLDEYNSNFHLVEKATEKLHSTEQVLVSEAAQAESVSNSIVDQAKTNIDSMTSSSKVLITIISLLAVAIGFVTATIISRSITVPMGTAVTVANKMADGDFTNTMNMDQKDEIGQFAASLDAMSFSLKDMINTIIQSSNSLASASTELASTTEELATTFNDQASQVSMVAAAVEELSSSSIEVLNSVNEVGEKSGMAKGLTNTGQSCVLSANSVMNDIKANVDGLGVTVGELSKSSEEIGNILLVINDIADQTNLLALNAAIEAARAGEHGRGFAVVADEVRKLAERTQQSIQQIESIISTFVSETKKTHQEMDKASDRVTAGVSTLNETSEIFNKIVRAVDEISTASGIITAAIQEQVTAINNINDNAHVISSGLEQSSAAITQVSSTVSDLQKQAEDQMQSTTHFKI